MKNRYDFMYSNRWINLLIFILVVFLISFPSFAGWYYIAFRIEFSVFSINVILVSLYTVLILFVHIYAIDKLLKLNSYCGYGILHDDFVEISCGRKLHSLKYKDIDSIERVPELQMANDRWIIFIKGHLKIPLGNIVIWETMVTRKRDRVKYIDPLAEFMDALKERLDGV